MTLIERAAEIDRKHHRVVRTMEIAVVRWIALGHGLAAAKKQVREELGPRKWLIWLAENTDVSERTAQIEVGFAKHETQLNEWLRGKNRNVADLSIRDANQIISGIKKANGGNGSGADPDEDGDDPDSDNDDDDKDNGNPDEKQFDALQEAYEEASLEVRDRFHQHLEKIYDLEVRPVKKKRKRQEQPDDGAVTAAVKTSEAEPHAAEAGS